MCFQVQPLNADSWGRHVNNLKNASFEFGTRERTCLRSKHSLELETSLAASEQDYNVGALDLWLLFLLVSSFYAMQGGFARPTDRPKVRLVTNERGGTSQMTSFLPQELVHCTRCSAFYRQDCRSTEYSAAVVCLFCVWRCAVQELVARKWNVYNHVDLLFVVEIDCSFVDLRIMCTRALLLTTTWQTSPAP